MRIHRTQNSCFAEFTQQISSVSTTEQFQAGVKSSLNGLRSKKSRLRRERAATEKCETARSEFFGANSKKRQSGICLQRFETLEKQIQFTRVCEDATFAGKVSIGMNYTTSADVDDGFGDRTPACRECTLPREDQNSRTYATIPGQTAIGPVLQLHIIQYLGINGIEI